MAPIETQLPRIGITCGDLNGIGMEIVLKAFSDPRMCEICTPVIFASAKVVSYHRKAGNFINLHYQQVKSTAELQPGKINVVNCWEADVNINLGEIDPVVGAFAIKSLKAAVKAYDEGGVDAIVTAPIHKAASYHETDFPYSGHTGFLAEHYRDKAIMLLCEGDFRVALLTDHIPLANVSETITAEDLEIALRKLYKSMRVDYGLQKPKIAVLGLNPHAGDEGLIGIEEQNIIGPTVEKLRNENMTIFGPFPADGFFGRGRQAQFDVVMAMYHDQGLAPFKALSFGSGVNITHGLPLIRTSPDHGTGFDIAGQNIADENSFRQSVFLALEVFKNRKMHKEDTKNVLKQQVVPRRGDR
ncbi:MAG: 4-hydroxythreonine-4-phosphate dehydrogenase PdxA [Cryomorphaceae bacterium]|nr:4-hydroxythreonine-4-phosphate dehydrogenase PdxA [Cryomorphaceae bacterium]